MSLVSEAGSKRSSGVCARERLRRRVSRGSHARAAIGGGGGASARASGAAARARIRTRRRAWFIGRAALSGGFAAQVDDGGDESRQRTTTLGFISARRRSCRRWARLVAVPVRPEAHAVQAVRGGDLDRLVQPRRARARCGCGSSRRCRARRNAPSCRKRPRGLGGRPAPAVAPLRRRRGARRRRGRDGGRRRCTGAARRRGAAATASASTAPGDHALDLDQPAALLRRSRACTRRRRTGRSRGRAWNGPRSLTRTTTDWPVSRLVTRA